MEASIKEPHVLQTYEELKSEFEKYACRIDDVLLYPVLDTKNERTLYTLLQLKERFSHLKYLEGKTEHKFVQEWADDPNKKAFRKMDVVPKNCPPDVYNLWEGYDIEKKNIASEETGDIQPFLDLLWDMSGGEETLRATDNDDMHVLVDVSILIVLQKLLDSGTITLDELEANKAAIVGSSNW